MEHIGLEPGRIQFSWISSAEAVKFVDVVREITQAVRALGPNKYFIKTPVNAGREKVA